MKTNTKWIARFIIVLSLGGGFAGLALSLQKLGGIADKGIDAGGVLVIIYMLLLSLIGIIFGLLLAEKRKKAFTWLKVFFILQIPVVISNAFIYKMFAGLGMSVTFGSINGGTGAFVSYRLGADYLFSFANQVDGNQFGINLFAVILLALLVYMEKTVVKK